MTATKAIRERQDALWRELQTELTPLRRADVEGQLTGLAYALQWIQQRSVKNREATA